MNVKIKYFASLREKAGKSQEDREFEAGKTLKDIYLTLAQQYGFDFEASQINYSLNNEYVDSAVSPKENEIVVFIPPVAGG